MVQSDEKIDVKRALEDLEQGRHVALKMPTFYEPILYVALTAVLSIIAALNTIEDQNIYKHLFVFENWSSKSAFLENALFMAVILAWLVWTFKIVSDRPKNDALRLDNGDAEPEAQNGRDRLVVKVDMQGVIEGHLGERRVVVLYGDSGVGKTHTLEQIADKNHFMLFKSYNSSFEDLPDNPGAPVLFDNFEMCLTSKKARKKFDALLTSGAHSGLVLCARSDFVPDIIDLLANNAQQSARPDFTILRHYGVAGHPQDVAENDNFIAKTWGKITSDLSFQDREIVYRAATSRVRHPHPVDGKIIVNPLKANMARVMVQEKLLNNATIQTPDIVNYLSRNDEIFQHFIESRVMKTRNPTLSLMALLYVTHCSRCNVYPSVSHIALTVSVPIQEGGAIVSELEDLGLLERVQHHGGDQAAKSEDQGAIYSTTQYRISNDFIGDQAIEMADLGGQSMNSTCTLRQSEQNYLRRAADSYASFQKAQKTKNTELLTGVEDFVVGHTENIHKLGKDLDLLKYQMKELLVGDSFTRDADEESRRIKESDDTAHRVSVVYVMAYVVGLVFLFAPSIFYPWSDQVAWSDALDLFRSYGLNVFGQTTAQCGPWFCEEPVGKLINYNVLPVVIAHFAWLVYAYRMYNFLFRKAKRTSKIAAKLALVAPILSMGSYLLPSAWLLTLTIVGYVICYQMRVIYLRTDMPKASRKRLRDYARDTFRNLTILMGVFYALYYGFIFAIQNMVASKEFEALSNYGIDAIYAVTISIITSILMVLYLANVWADHMTHPALARFHFIAERRR